MGFDLDYGNRLAPGPGRGNASYIMGIADFFVTPSSLSYPPGRSPRDLGYKVIETDSEWDLPTRAPNGSLVPDPTKYPRGLEPVVNYLHDRKLMFGLYGDRGNLDCNKNPGQLGHEQADADFLAAHNIDWFKMDSCFDAGDEPTAIKHYTEFRNALNNTGAKIWFALCGWKPWYAPPDPSIGYGGGLTLGNSWRTGPDTGSGWQSVLTNFANALSVSKYTGRTENGGGWNDGSLLLNPGMGCPGAADAPVNAGPSTCMDETRSQTMFSMWSVLSLNLIMTGNLPLIAQKQPSVIRNWLNGEAIAVNQDVDAWKPEQGRYTKRLDGSNTSSLNLLPTSSVSYLEESHMAECGGEPTGQTWLLDSPLKGYISDTKKTTCLSIADCKSPMYYDSCETDPTRRTCAGLGNYSHFQWTLDQQSGLLRSWLREDLCAQVQSSSEDLAAVKCDASDPMQVFQYTASSGHLTLKKTGHCMTANGPPAPGPAGHTSVYGRPLSTGGWAVFMLNDTPQNATVACDSSCFAQMGFNDTSQSFQVRDIIQHAGLPAVTAGGGLHLPVVANGGSVFVTVTPQKR